MFNLLPEDQKAEIRSIYLSKFTLAILLFTFVMAVIIVVSLLPSYFLVHQQEQAALARQESIENYISVSNKGDINQQLNALKAKIKILTPTDAVTTAILSTIIADRGSDVKISTFDYTRLDKGHQIVLSGVSATREGLLMFSRRLQQEQHFTNVDLPISNFAKDKDIAFSMTIHISN